MPRPKDHKSKASYIHTDWKRTQKWKFSLMFEFFSSISSDFFLTILAFAFTFAWCKMGLNAISDRPPDFLCNMSLEQSPVPCIDIHHWFSQIELIEPIWWQKVELRKISNDHLKWDMSKFDGQLETTIPQNLYPDLSNYILMIIFFGQFLWRNLYFIIL